MLSAEVVPFAKTGGLADVAGALPKALGALGHDVRVCMPRYQPIAPERFGLRKIIETLDVPLDVGTEQVAVYEGQIGNDVPVYFIDNAQRYGTRDQIYGYHDDGERFILFCRAALEACRYRGWRPDVIHCNDWHTGLVPNWLKTVYVKDEFFRHTASVYTIHNLAYQGVFGYRILEVAGIADQGFIYPQISELAEHVDFMGRGILFADMITTVSERYAEEILTPEYGEKLDPLLRERRDRLVGILNGIDVDVHNPATDPFVSHPYTASDIAGKAAQKAELQKVSGLPVMAKTPLIGIISRLTDQKGFDILGYQIDAMLKRRVQLVLLGTGDSTYHDLFTRLAERYPNIAVHLTFNAELAQTIYAGSDMFLMPSRFEPCGLGQMIAMRYGSIPIVRATGGLADTVDDYDPATGKGTGFVFHDYDCWELFAAVVRAQEAYRVPATWQSLMRRAMERDFSWVRSAHRYVDVYHRAVALCTG